jgi:hypothetical protein
MPLSKISVVEEKTSKVKLFVRLSARSHAVIDSLEQRSEALKVLVEQEFDRFVGVKAATAGSLLSCLFGYAH